MAPVFSSDAQTAQPWAPRWVVAGLLGVAMFAAWAGVAGAADFDQRPTGQTSYKLKWLPYRPSEPAVAERAAESRVIQTAASSPIRTAQRPAGSAFDDPFGDAGGAMDPFPLEMAPPGGISGGNDLPEAMPAAPADSGFGPEPAEAIPPVDRGPLVIERPVAGGRLPAESCPSPTDPVYYTRIGDLKPDITPGAGALPSECMLTEATIRPFAAGQVRGSETGRPWEGTTYMWKASALCHKPLYFEDPHLERYGHSWGPHLQPLVSGARFFLGVPALPYQMGLYPPFECVYALGEYRPGSCAPKMLDPLPLSIRAALVQGGVWTGMVAAIP